jgi:hypothetical protein
MVSAVGQAEVGRGDKNPVGRSSKRLAREIQHLRERLNALPPSLRVPILVIALGASIFLVLGVVGAAALASTEALPYLGGYHSR